MASSSVSQEDFENDFELNSRRSRIRTARARVVPPRTGDAALSNYQSMSQFSLPSLSSYLISLSVINRSLPKLITETAGDVEEVCEIGPNCVILPEHDNQQNKPMMRKQDKRLTSRYVLFSQLIPRLQYQTLLYSASGLILKNFQLYTDVRILCHEAIFIDILDTT